TEPASTARVGVGAALATPAPKSDATTPATPATVAVIRRAVRVTGQCWKAPPREAPSNLGLLALLTGITSPSWLLIVGLTGTRRPQPPQGCGDLGPAHPLSTQPSPKLLEARRVCARAIDPCRAYENAHIHACGQFTGHSGVSLRTLTRPP